VKPAAIRTGKFFASIEDGIEERQARREQGRERQTAQVMGRKGLGHRGERISADKERRQQRTTMTGAPAGGSFNLSAPGGNPGGARRKRAAIGTGNSRRRRAAVSPRSTEKARQARRGGGPTETAPRKGRRSMNGTSASSPARSGSKPRYRVVRTRYSG